MPRTNSERTSGSTTVVRRREGAGTKRPAALALVAGAHRFGGATAKGWGRVGTLGNGPVRRARVICFTSRGWVITLRAQLIGMIEVHAKTHVNSGIPATA